MSCCHKLKMYNPYICATRCRRPLIFQTMNFVRSKVLSFKYYQIYTIKELEILSLLQKLSFFQIRLPFLLPDPQFNGSHCRISHNSFSRDFCERKYYGGRRGNPPPCNRIGIEG